MKALTLLTLVFLTTTIQSQIITREQAEAFADSLVKYEFLTPLGKSTLLKEIDSNKIAVEHTSTVNSITYDETELSKETILRFCYEALASERNARANRKGMRIERRIKPKEPLDAIGVYSWNMLMFGRSDYNGCISPKTSFLGYTRQKTLSAFLKAGLIDEKIYRDCQAALQAKKLPHELLLLQYMLFRSTHYRFYEFNKNEQTEYITHLAKNGLLTEAGKEKLLKSYKDYELKTKPEILKESPRYRLVDLHSYSADPKLTYPVIFEAIRELLPNFNYRDLTIQLLEEKQGDLMEQKIKLSFKVDSVQYTNIFFYDFVAISPPAGGPAHEAPRVVLDFHKGVNKWLTESGSPYRLFTINISDESENYYGERSVGLLILKQGEDTLIINQGYFMSSESFESRYTRKNIDSIFGELQQNGFFSHVSAKEIDSARQVIDGSYIESIDDLFLLLPKTVVVFDWEMSNLENPYEEITRAFETISRGNFTVTNITDGFKKAGFKAKQTKYGFTLNGKRYEKMLEAEDDWMDPSFLDLIHSALSENKVNGRFYYCIDNGQESGYMFLSDAQYQFVKDKFPELLKEN